MIKRSVSIIIVLFIFIIIFPGCPGSDPPVNNPPYDITEPAEVTFVNSYSSTNYISLIVDSPGVDLDQDGDVVIFESSALLNGFSLDQDNGVITIVHADLDEYGTTYDVEITVWTVDEHSSKSANFIITVHLTAPS